MPEQPASQPIPIGATIQPLPLLLDQVVYGGQVTAYYAEDSGNYLLFPVFSINKAGLKISGASVDLADANGFLNITPASQNVVLTVSIINFFMEKAYRDAVLSAFITAVTTTSDKVSTVAINGSWHANIAIPSNQNIVSTDLIFFANTSVLSQDIVLDPQILQGVKVSDLRFYIGASYRAEFAQDVFKVKLNLIGKTITSLTNKIASTSGAVGAVSPTYLIGVGGDILGGGTGLEDIRTAFQIQVLKNAEIPPDQSDWANKMVDELLTNIPGMVTNFRVDQLADKNTVVSFLLGNQVKITAPIGELQDVEHHLDTQTDDQLRTDYENSLDTNSTISASAKGSFGPISVGASGSSAQSRKEASKQMLDSTRKNLSKLDDIIKGNIPNVTALDVNQFQQFVTDAGFTGSVDFANFQDSTATTDFDPFSLAVTSETLVNTNGNPIGTILDWGGEIPPYGYLPCDGRPLPNSEPYIALFSAIGTLYGSGIDDAGNAVGDFNLPDRRGVFPRGVDPSGLRDSDFASRTALHGGTANGGMVGSYQPDDFKSHNHDVNEPPHSHTSNAQVEVVELFAGGGNSGNGHEEPNGNSKATIQPNVTGITIRNTGGNETRAKNVYVNYIIKYK